MITRFGLYLLIMLISFTSIAAGKIGEKFDWGMSYNKETPVSDKKQFVKELEILYGEDVIKDSYKVEAQIFAYGYQYWMKVKNAPIKGYLKIRLERVDKRSLVENTAYIVDSETNKMRVDTHPVVYNMAILGLLYDDARKKIDFNFKLYPEIKLSESVLNYLHVDKEKLEIYRKEIRQISDKYTPAFYTSWIKKKDKDRKSKEIIKKTPY